MADPGKSDHLYSNNRASPANSEPGVPYIPVPREITSHVPTHLRVSPRPPDVRLGSVTPPPAHQRASPQHWGGKPIAHLHQIPVPTDLSRPSSRGSPAVISRPSSRGSHLSDFSAPVVLSRPDSRESPAQFTSSFNPYPNIIQSLGSQPQSLPGPPPLRISPHADRQRDNERRVIAGKPSAYESHGHKGVVDLKGVKQLPPGLYNENTKQFRIEPNNPQLGLAQLLQIKNPSVSKSLGPASKPVPRIGEPSMRQVSLTQQILSGKIERPQQYVQHLHSLRGPPPLQMAPKMMSATPHKVDIPLPQFVAQNFSESHSIQVPIKLEAHSGLYTDAHKSVHSIPVPNLSERQYATVQEKLKQESLHTDNVFRYEKIVGDLQNVAQSEPVKASVCNTKALCDKGDDEKFPVTKIENKVPVELKTMENPYNQRIKNLGHFPVQQNSYRATYRSHSMAMHRAKAGSITSAAKSLDILRQNLQSYINKEIDVIIQKYLDEYFKPGIDNIKLNNGEAAVGEEHVFGVCRQILEEAKKLYVSETRSVTPDISDNVSESGSLVENRTVRQNKHSLFNIRKRRGSSDSEKSLPRKKKKGRNAAHASGRSTPMKGGKNNEPVKREGEKWDPDRLTTETLFVMGAKANKALGLGATRGRLYIKHPDVFKYSGDQDDKQWLYENHFMPATGGKAYMLLVEDMKALSETDEYKDSPGLLLDELQGFAVPSWMIEKMKVQMQSLRTDAPKAPKVKTNSTPGNAIIGGQVLDFEEANGHFPLPFSTLSSNLDEKESQASPDATENLDRLSTFTDDDRAVSPFNMTGGFGDISPAPGASPTASDLDALEEEGTGNMPFELQQ